VPPRKSPTPSLAVSDVSQPIFVSELYCLNRACNTQPSLEYRLLPFFMNHIDVLLRWFLSDVFCQCENASVASESVLLHHLLGFPTDPLRGAAAAVYRSIQPSSCRSSPHVLLYRFCPFEIRTDNEFRIYTLTPIRITRFCLPAS
jgi:hypothetical protein